MHVYPFSAPLVTARRSMNVEHFNAVANHDSVRAGLGGDGPIELGPTKENPAGIVTDLKNYSFETAHGGFILWSLGYGRYDVHSLFTPEGRGQEAQRAMAEVAAYMFTHTDCTEGRTTVPEGNTGAGALAIRGGFERRFELERMPWTAGETTKAAFLSLTLEKWALTAPIALDAGRWFHQQLDAAKTAARSDRPTHADEAVHDRMAGAVVLMVRGGQAEKAVAFYRTWAMTAHYATITLLSKRPVVIDLVDAVIEASEDGMEILTCR